MEINMFFLVLLILIPTFVLIIQNKRPKSNLPPTPPSLPIIGHLHLLKEPLHKTLHNMSHNFGPVMLLRFGVRKVVVLTSPSAVEECFTKTNDVVVANRPQLMQAKHLNYNYTTMGAAPYGTLWHALRRVAATELLSATRLDTTTNLREHEVKLMCRQIYNDSSHKVNFKSWFRDLTNNITTMAIIGKRYYGDEINMGDLKEAVEFREMMEEFFIVMHTETLGDFIPVIRWIGFDGVEKKMIDLI
ncbi:hypothetical protein SSX86_007490 [Deinandra increscens subsp. villosa]|uniref:Cytochrome P450 n=1 Tax=Deinandra increscens subsp. villosa TaxID=3103831 RepID=A0AAP0DDK8_9ASTR